MITIAFSPSADVVRHPLVGRIVRAYDAQYAVHEESEEAGR